MVNHAPTIREIKMPTYEYECSHCNYEFEELQSMLDKKLKKCPECGKNTLHRLIGSGSGIVFKGSGFYETDYKKKEAPKSECSEDPSKPCCKGKTEACATAEA